MTEDKLDKFELPSWKDLLSVAGLILAGFMLGFFYYWIGAFWTFVACIGILIIVFWTFSDKEAHK